MRKIIIITLILLASVELYAQPRSSVAAGVPKKEEKPKKEKAWMKPPEKPNATISEAWAPVELDHYIGIRGGYGMGTGRFEPIKQEQSYMGLINFGISYRLDMKNKQQKYVGAIEFDLEYMERGYAQETYFESGIVYKRKYSTITLPILWQPYLPLSKSGESRVYLNAGPSLGYVLKSSFFTEDTKTGTITNEGTWDFNMLRDNRFEYGIVAGGGVIVAIKKKVILGVDFRYNIMLSDIYKGVTKYAGNPFRSPVDVMSLSLKLEYKFDGNKKKKKK